MDIRFENQWTEIDGSRILAKANRYDLEITPKSHVVYDWSTIRESVIQLLRKHTPDRRIRFVDEKNLLITSNSMHYTSDKFSINLDKRHVWRPDYPQLSLEDRISGMLYRRFSLETSSVKLTITPLYSENVLFYGDRRGDSDMESSYFYPNLVHFKFYKNHLPVDDDVLDSQISEIMGKVYLPQSELSYRDKQTSVYLRKIDGDDMSFGFDHDYDQVVVMPSGGTHPQAMVNYAAEHLKRFASKVDYIIMFLHGIEYRAKVIPEV